MFNLSEKEVKTKPGLDLSSAECVRNPYPVYQYLRDNYPVCQVEPTGFWAVSRYDDVAFAFKHPEIFSSSGFDSILQPDWLNKNCWLDQFILTKDPPEHGILRKAVNKSFVKRVIDAQIPSMRRTIRALIKETRKRSEIAFMREFCAPYAASVILNVTGTKGKQKVGDIYHWVRCIERVLNPVRPDDKTIKEIESAINKQNNYFEGIIIDRRNKPKEDFVSEMAGATVLGGELLSDIQIRSALNLFVASGFHTSMHTLSKAVYYLSRNHDVYKKLSGSIKLIPAFIEEMLRYDSTVHGLMRRAQEDITLSEITIPEGATVLLLPASANRDSRRFPNPDVFDMSRSNICDHLAFGSGMHACIGANLARLELKVALEEILLSFDGVVCPPDSSLEWITSVTNNGFCELPVQFY